MRKYFDIFKNWRIDVLTLMFSAGIALLVCDGDNITVLIAAKAAGLALIYLCGIFVHIWNGKMKELDVFNIEEDDDEQQA